MLLVKEIEERPRWKYAWTYLQETLALGLGLTKTPSGSRKLNFETVDWYRDRLETLGLMVEVRQPKTPLLYPHVDIAGRKTR